jgi:uncharacterized protein (TIGR04255 family)
MSTIVDFEKPPVVETILGVQFDELPGMTNGHLGAFWQTLDPSEWTAAADAPPLNSQFEQFTDSGRWGRGLKFQLSQVPASRLQVRNRAGNRMIQIQNGRLHFNWIGEAGDPYPRYENIKTGFESAFDAFCRFATLAEIGPLKANQWEVTYINLIPRGTVWNTPADWNYFSLLAAMPSIPGVVEGESFSGQWHFVIPGERGRLHIEWQHGKKSEEELAEECVRLNLTARGPLTKDADDRAAVLSDLDLGRETIVKTFAALMSAEANDFWGLRHVDT